jgi:hypothetical protein
VYPLGVLVHQISIHRNRVDFFLRVFQLLNLSYEMMMVCKGSISMMLALLSVLSIGQVVISMETEKLVSDFFSRSFTDKCSKYSFVNQQHRLLEHANPYTSKFVEFIFSEPKAVAGDRGGFGDRLAGLITAALMAWRFDRVLIISAAEPEFYEYFEPLLQAQSFSEFNYPDYSALVQKIRAENASDVLNLDRCVNPEYETAFKLSSIVPAANSDICGLDYESKDPPQRVIRLRSNRCYLCRYVFSDRPNTPVRADLMNKMNITKDSNLYEIAGCILRLAMSPSDVMISKLAGVVSTQFMGRRAQANKNSAIAAPTKGEVAAEDYLAKMERTAVVQLLDSTYQMGGANNMLPYMIGAHFRCGDKFMTGNSDQCWHDPAKNIADKSIYMKDGNPVEIGKCANKVISQFMKIYDSTFAVITRDNRSKRKPDPKMVINVASDNMRSQQQVKLYTSPNGVYDSSVFMSPVGCHIDLNSTSSCMETTVVQWLLFSMNDIYINPVQPGEKGLFPASGFSRYASLYGLGGDNIMNPKTCSVFSTKALGTMQHANWLCRS